MQELRELTAQSLDLGLRRGLEMTVAQVRANGRDVDRNSLGALRFLQERMQTE